MTDKKRAKPLDRYDCSPQWPWAVAILLVVIYGLAKGVA
jgi:hypothetical protein